MLIERFFNKIDKPARAALLASLISAGGGLPTASTASQINSGKRIEFVGSEELISAQENPGVETNRQVVEAILKKDPARVKQLLHPLYHDWYVYGRREAGTLPEQEILALFSKAFTRGQPSCLGYTLRPGWNTEEASIVFENLSALEGQNLSRASMVTVGFRRGGALKWGISEVEELTQTQLSEIRKNLQDCSAILQKSEVKPAPEKVELPKDLPKGKIVYVAGKDGKGDVYISNIDGTEEARLTQTQTDKRDLALLPNGKAAFVELHLSNSNQADKVVSVDIKTRKEEVLLTTKPDESFPVCLAPDKPDGLIFHKYTERTSFEDLYRLGKDGQLERLTRDKDGSAENCPVVSPDGRFVAFRVYVVGAPGAANGIVIYPREELKNFKTIIKPSDAPVFLNGSQVHAWFSDNEHILYSDNAPVRQGLYTARRDGTETVLITRMEVLSASLSPDGKWIVFASRDGLYLVSSSGGAPTRLRGNGYYVQWLPDLVPSRKQIALVPGMLTFIENKIEVNGRFSPLRDRLVEEDLNFRYSDFFVSGFMGGYFDERGYYYTGNQTCENTLQSFEVSAQNEAGMVLGWLEHHPNDELIIVAHSFAGPVMLRAFEKIREKNPNIDLSRVKLITTDSPNQGINKSPLDILGQILPAGLPSDCYIAIPVVGRTPPPQVLDYPATRELLAMWDKRGETQARWQRLTTWMKERGAEEYGLGSYYDCVIALEMCISKVVGRWPWDLILPWWLDWVDNPWFYATLPSVLWTQEVPGATANIMRALKNDVDWGHTPYLNEGEGMEILVTLIGEQKKPRRRKEKRS